MENVRDKNKISETVPSSTRKRTIMPPELFESGIVRRNKELLKLLGVNNGPLILTITSIYKDKESCCKGNYRGRGFYNSKDKLIAKYKESEDD